ncbi:MAG TPA: tyrosine-type recombinase/integrase [Ktedonobacteraceae bacterium]
MTEEEETPEAKQPRKRGKRRPRAHGTGSVFQRKDRKGKQWVAQLVLENGKTRQRYFTTQSEAATALNEMLYQQRQGKLATGPRQTVKQYLEYWIEIHRASVKVSTYVLYRRLLDNHILPELGNYQLQSLTVDQVQAFYAKKQQEQLAPRTLHNFHAILSTAFKDAVKWKRLSVNVCEHVTLPRISKYEVKPLDQEQAKRLLDVARGGRLECLLTLALVSGMRVGEMLALRWGDINFEEKSLQVRHTVNFIEGYGFVETEPKTESSRRTIALPQVAVDTLQQHRTTQLTTRLKAGADWQELNLVFPNEHGGYLGRAWVQKHFKRLVEQAGLPPMRMHDLRHSAATILLSMKVDAKVVQEILGHANISMTLGIYGHVLPSMQKDAVDAMDDLFGER